MDLVGGSATGADKSGIDLKHIDAKSKPHPSLALDVTYGFVLI